MRGITFRVRVLSKYGSSQMSSEHACGKPPLRCAGIFDGIGHTKLRNVRIPDPIFILDVDPRSMERFWIVSAFSMTEMNFCRIMGYRNLWTLETILSKSRSVTQEAEAK